MGTTLNSILLVMVVFVFVATPKQAVAQQDPLFTQYTNNMLLINPAYAGSRDAMTMVLLHRDQWVGIEGAPETQTLTFHSPFRNQNFAFGTSLMHDKIGPSTTTSIFGDFTARVQLDRKSHLAFGLKAGFKHYVVDLTRMAVAESDPLFQENVNSWLPNIGMGVYYHRPRFYAGFSIPKFVEDDLDGTDNTYGIDTRHMYFITGGVVDLSPYVKFKPTMMVRYADAAPLSGDFTANLLFYDRLWTGAFYRTDLINQELPASWGLMVAFQINPQFKIGYSYDRSLSDLQYVNDGSHEISVTFDFVFEKDKIKSPRYF
ncbi:type IX secretion system membrane protein PorP/SprF [Cryomorphaceae bacterium]|nr:type IX secretion system membrane protein PorP/SprF [Cryomorphaceae bacterium]